MGGRTGRQHEAFASGLIQSAITAPRETTTSPGGHGGRLDCLSCLHLPAARPRSRSLSPQGARRLGSRSADLDVRLGRAGAGVLGLRLLRLRAPLARSRHDARIPSIAARRFPTAASTTDGRRSSSSSPATSSRNRSASTTCSSSRCCSVLRGATRVSASRAVLGHSRRRRDARR